MLDKGKLWLEYQLSRSMFLHIVDRIGAMIRFQVYDIGTAWMAVKAVMK